MRSAVTPEADGFAGIVLAGGASSRMGEDKARLELGGITLLEHTIQRLRAAGADAVIVSGDRPGFDAVADRDPGRGPLGGMASVLAARPELHQRLLLIVPTDTPGLTPAAMRQLVRAAEGGTGARFAGHPLPLAVRDSLALRQTLRTLLDGPGRASAQHLGQRLGVKMVSAGNVDLSNVNTPQDWQRFCRESV